MITASNKRRELQNLFQSELDGGTLILRAQRDFNEASWGSWFGPVQKALEERVWEGNAIQHCRLDFTNCRWADPLPLLSLAISLVEFEWSGGVVSLVFPQPCIAVQANDREHKEDCIERSQLLKFLAREGILQLLAFPKVTSLPVEDALPRKKRKITIGSEQLTPENCQEKLKEYADHWAPLAFEESTCLKAALLKIRRPRGSDDSASLDEIDQWVDQALYQNIEQVVNDKVPRWAQRGLTYRMLMFLRETLHNVAEHAYEESGLAVVYVRYREGALGQAPSTWNRLDKYVKRESNNACTPLLQTKRMVEAFARTHTGYFEIYVVDSGYGLCRTLRNSASNKRINQVHKSMLDVFERWCSSKSERSTEYGGLYLIRLLLEPVGDYVRVRDEDTWWGTELPIQQSEKGVRLAGQLSIDARGLEHTGKHISGLAWTSRLSWKERGDIPGHKQPWRGLGKEEENTHLLSVLEDTSYDPSITVGTHIHDYRFTREPWSITEDTTGQPVQLLLLLPGGNWMRNHIQYEIAGILNNGFLAQNGSLIIGDIASEEALTYLAAIQNAGKFTTHPLSIPSRIILVTRDLKACVLERNNKQLFRPLDSLSGRYVSATDRHGTHASHGLMQYVRLLRFHDARRFWEIVGQNIYPGYKHAGHDSPGMFVDEPVDWNNGITLDCYLDFAQTLTHPVCREIYTVALQRLSGLFPAQDCQLSALDSLVDSLVIRYNADRHSYPRYKYEGGQRILAEALPKHLQIGSIQVSGLTEISESNGGTEVFHFFRHPNGTANGKYLLPWLASSSVKTPELSLGEQHLHPGTYRRVGRTPVIARDGWKAYQLPRFNDREQSVCEQGPRDSYRAWQEPSRTTMKIGHWRYGGHHDLLSVNLMLAFDTELDRISLVLGGSLARWVFANLFRIFAVERKDLNKVGQSLLVAIENDKYQRLLSEQLADQKPVLVYPSHPVTDHIFDRFLALFDNSARLDEVRARTLAVLPVRRHRGGSGLQISGLTLERIDGLVTGRGRKRPPVVFFDDAVISGRTYEELKRLLRSKGFKNIYSLALLDRQRLPSSDHIGGKQHVCYWRQDVPSMGSQGHCPLCRALGRINDLSAGIVSKDHQRRIESWKEHWVARNPTTDWGDSGLRPSPLLLAKPERRFGIIPDKDHPGTYRQIGGNDQQIRLSNSAGLVAWVTELHSMTSRDDLPLSMLEKESLDPEVRIQLVASQLLLFFGELDATLAHDLGLRLLAALWDAKEHDRNTALAVLTLVACGNKYLGRIVQEFMKVEVRNHLVVDADRDLSWANVDFVILLAFCLEFNLLDETRALERAGRLLKPSGKRRDLYYRLHREIQNVQGVAHSSPLHRLCQWEALPPGFERSIPDVIASVGQLKAILDGLEYYWLRANTDACKSYGEVRDAIEGKIDKLESVLRILEEEIGIGRINTARQSFQECQALARDLLNLGNKLHTALFAPLGIQSIDTKKSCEILYELERIFPPRETIDGKVIALHKSKYLTDELDVKKLNKPNLKEAYIVWDSEVTWALREILTNVRQAEGEAISCPWDECDHSLDKANLWVRMFPCKHDERFIVIELVNHTSDTAQNVEKKTRQKHFRQIFRDFGRDVNFRKNGGLLFTSIHIPYAHTLLRTRIEEISNG